MNHEKNLNRAGWRAVTACLAVAFFVLPEVLCAQPDDAKDPKAAGSEVLNLFEKYKDEYEATDKPALVKTGPANYLTITGKGPPGSEEFKNKIGALYSIAYPLKFKTKATGRDYVVCPLEGLWWGENDEVDFCDQPKSTWQWKLLIRTPEFVKESDVQAMVNHMGAQSAVAKEIKLETIDEGQCVQMLHVGPYEEEPENIKAMHAFAKEKGLSLNGRHHEIYLSDPNRTPPEKLRTILRRPVK